MRHQPFYHINAGLSTIFYQTDIFYIIPPKAGKYFLVYLSKGVYNNEEIKETRTHPMAKRIYKSRKRRRRNPLGSLLIMLVLALAVLALVLALLWPTLWEGGDTPASSAPMSTTTTASTTASTTAESTTAESTTAATTGSSAAVTTTTTTAPSYDDRYIDGDGMLQFNTAGHYVQSSAYASSADIPWALRLVNDWNPMPLGYDTNLQMQSILGDAGSKQVDGRIMEDLKRMLEAGKQYNIGVQSAYRSTAKQSELYWRQVNKWKSQYKDEVQLQTKAGEIVKRPGYSEHNVGLAVDLYGSGDYSLTESFAQTPAYAWLIENCADYGFILRFPKGKEAITGVVYEAWHFRYVGDPVTAHKIMDAGLCLEEYLEQNQK